jgi:hypothetical protein
LRFHQSIDQARERHRLLGVLRQLQCHVHVLFGPLAGRLAPSDNDQLAPEPCIQRIDIPKMIVALSWA